MARSIGKKITAIQHSVPYELVYALLAISSVVFLAIEYLIPNVPPAMLAFMVRVDLFIAFAFLADFVVGIYFSDNRRLYFRHNWLNLLSSVPASENVFRAFRFLRIVRSVRIFRITRTASAVANVKQVFGITKQIKEQETKKPKPRVT